LNVGSGKTLAVAGTLTVTGSATVEFADGSASTPSITNDGDTNTGIFFPAADTIAFAEGGTEAMRLDSGGYMGLGVTPAAWALSGAPALQIKNAAFVGYLNNAYMTANTYFDSVGGARYIASANASYYAQTSGQHQWFTAASGTAGAAISLNQAMTLDASGNLLLGVTSGTRRLNITYAAASGGIYLETSNADSTFLSCIRSATVHVQHKIIGSTYQIVNDSAGVSLAAGGTSWGSLSDERKKDIIEPITNATNKLSTLRAVIGKYKTEEDGIRRAMLIAQDVQAVLPEAVVENKDGDLILQYTDTIPLLVAAIKEQQALIQTLTDRITALEAK
jgi:hypothetical protein